jgi:single-strand DNA-binding protein
VALSYEKDDNVYVEGSLQQRKFTPADGVTRTIHEVHARSCHGITTFGSIRENRPTRKTATQRLEITMILRGLFSVPL